MNKRDFITDLFVDVCIYVAVRYMGLSLLGIGFLVMIETMRYLLQTDDRKER